MDHRPDLGRRGERAAADHLAGRGWVVLAQRWRGGRGAGELDLVARRGSVLAICEVKVRRALGPEDVPVSARQRARILAGAAAFRRAHPGLAHLDVHLDLLLVTPRRGPWRVAHHPRALEW
jgi:putative endonuclease